MELSLSQLPGGDLAGTIADENTTPQVLTDLSWDSAGRWLEFKRSLGNVTQWFRVSLRHGTLSGRFSHLAGNPSKPALSSYAHRITGWSPAQLDQDIVPRAWAIQIGTRYPGVLRIDRDAQGQMRGRLKIFDDTKIDGIQEELESDLLDVQWDGSHLSFVRMLNTIPQKFSGTVQGRTIAGGIVQVGGSSSVWTGSRSEVLGFGLGSRLVARAAWQEETRARIFNLTEGMRLDDTVASMTVSEVPCDGCPFQNGTDASRDDDAENWPANYTLKRLKFSVSLAGRFDPSHPPPPREFFGYLATPPGAGPFKAMLAFNGHGGSARRVMTSGDSLFWYGDSAARRGFVVLAIDVGHRIAVGPEEVIHPAIVEEGYNSTNWENDGERAFNARRAIDFLASLPSVRADRIFLEGLSMGGEVATITAALDPRAALTVSAGYSPDMNIMDLNGNHGCYRWTDSNIHEYLDVSDFEALIAPRVLIVETGQQDFTFSPSNPPFAADKQVLLRARSAYGPDAGNLIHFLHSGAHQFRVGGGNLSSPSEGVLVPQLYEPALPGNTGWQTDATTTLRSATLYSLLDELAP